jgi:hypothetical protein
MKLICINGATELLTINKTYEVIKNNKGQYLIKDNYGEERWYNTNRFKDIATIREEKLKQIGI